MKENNITRREALGYTASVFGTAVFGSAAFLSGCSPEKEYVPFSPGDIALLDEVGETILPATDDSPGAKAAHIGEFMKTIVEDCYTAEEYEVFVTGINTLRSIADRDYGRDFSSLPEAERIEMLVKLDKEARESDTHFYTMIRQLTIWGYFTSEPGATRALRYVPVPGRFDGCIPYNPGDKAWA